MRSLEEFAAGKLAALERAQLRRMPAVTARTGIWVERDGRRLLSFSCNDYLNLSQHPQLIAAAIDATKRDGVFSMDGDIAPLAALSQLAQRFDAWLLSDDAHGLGVIGGGRGSAFVNGAAHSSIQVPLQMGTLSKAIGAYGGYLCASRAVIDLMRTRAR